MEIAGEHHIQCPRDEVWTALNDPEVLRCTLPGCESLEQQADNDFQARVKSKIGPVKATFNVKVTLENLDPPRSYTLSGEGQGGVAGFARGSADVQLEERDKTTLLRYKAQFRVGGKLAQVGSRLVTGAARKTADQFFTNFAAYLNPTEPDSQPAGSGGG
ncbi:MAG: carbon monoxide dehydrogenase subunit G [Candidatus Competibacterales bacterium]|nr:carbon monoxide dehydrogenase subunit G [Candidatus Competibacterales bacterium]